MDGDEIDDVEDCDIGGVVGEDVGEDVVVVLSPCIGSRSDETSMQVRSFVTKR